MLEFVVSNYIIFIIAAVVLLLGLFGYIVDKKKYEQYRQEIVNDERALDMLDNQPDLDDFAAPELVQNDASLEGIEDPMTGQIQ